MQISIPSHIWEFTPATRAGHVPERPLKCAGLSASATMEPSSGLLWLLLPTWLPPGAIDGQTGDDSDEFRYPRSSPSLPCAPCGKVRSQRHLVREVCLDGVEFLLLRLLVESILEIPCGTSRGEPQIASARRATACQRHVSEPVLRTSTSLIPWRLELPQLVRRSSSPRPYAADFTGRFRFRCPSKPLILRRNPLHVVYHHHLHGHLLRLQAQAKRPKGLLDGREFARSTVARDAAGIVESPVKLKCRHP